MPWAVACVTAHCFTEIGICLRPVVVSLLPSGVATRAASCGVEEKTADVGAQMRAVDNPET
ncbi:hypothetical protein HK16_04400 [Acetobacter senegalensis]|uniref:Uncharacterized protein n=1 Tax=Acetobacter senegalensis TaxID=446692 RepID=A0A252EE32_9PROT|nr:hypothetical protein HK16_04400 [Acetobacter senegalensis]